MKSEDGARAWTRRRERLIDERIDDGVRENTWDSKKDGKNGQGNRARGGIVEELKELRKVIEEMVSVLRKVASELERREDVEQVSERSEVRRQREGAGIEESWVEGERSVKEERREQEEGRKSLR